MKYVASTLKMTILKVFLVTFIVLMVNQVSFSSKIPANSDLKNLVTKKIFFAHQSVGRNILDGVRDLMSGRIEKINIFDFVGPLNIEQPGIYDTLIGKNTKPQSKIDDFYEKIKQARVKPDIAFLKLCFVDVTSETNIKKLFSYYKSIISKIETENPDIRIVHFTVPLKVNRETWKTKLKNILGKDMWEYADNIKRNEYNQMLLAEYLDREPVFDLAGFESTFVDGSRESFEYHGATYYTLVSDYSSDGGHLNEVGRKIIAEKLLSVLSHID